jgi:deoxyribonuclease-4
MRFGFHVTIAGGFAEAIKRAVRIGCETMQLFSRNPRGWASGRLDQNEASLFCQDAVKHQIAPVIVHMPYLPNLASADTNLYAKSVSILREELRRAEALGAAYLVTHVGHRGQSREDEALARVARAIDTACTAVPNDVMILLENTAGQGSEVGYSFAHLGRIVDRAAHHQRVGICLDIAHAFAAGYAVGSAVGLERTLDELAKALDIKRLRLVHLNDAKAPAGSRIDRHWHIGQGQIGRAGFRRIVNHPLLQHLPAVMETPKESERDDIRNMRTARRLAVRRAT